MIRFLIPALCLCLPASAQAATGDQGYFPVADHARWTYSIEIAMPDGLHKGERVRQTNGRERIGGKEYYKITTVTSGIPGVQTENEHMREDPSGAYELDDEKSGEFSVAPLSLTAGAAWDLKSSRINAKCKVEGFEPAEVAGRKLDHCATIKCTGEIKAPDGTMGLESTSLRCPGVGLVKEDLVFKAGAQKAKTTLVLKSFALQ